MHTFKIITIFFLLLISAKAGQDGPFTYQIHASGTEIWITNYSGRNLYGTCYIPSSIEGKPVTKIGPNFFGSNMQWVSFPASLKTIEAGTFYNCRLESVEFPNGLKSIGAGAFGACGYLQNIIIPASVETIGEAPFQYCPLLGIDVATTNLKYIQIDGVLFEREGTGGPAKKRRSGNWRGELTFGHCGYRWRDEGT